MSHPTPDRHPHRVITVAILLAFAASPTGRISTDATLIGIRLDPPRPGSVDPMRSPGPARPKPQSRLERSGSLDADLAVRVALSRDAGVRRTLAQVAQARRAPRPIEPNPTGPRRSDRRTRGCPRDGRDRPATHLARTRPTRLEAADAELKSGIMDAAWSIVETDAAVRGPTWRRGSRSSGSGSTKYAVATNLSRWSRDWSMPERPRRSIWTAFGSRRQGRGGGGASRIAAREAIRLLARMGVPAPRSNSR